MKKKQHTPIDYDTHWKDIISNLFEDFILFFLPDAHKLINFQAPVEFLEQELHKIIADNIKRGHVVNDKLVKVQLKDGSEKWILIHIEIQSSFDSRFPERMFTYFYRIYDKYNQQITAIALYTGSKNPKNHDKFNYEFLGTKLAYEFNSVKIDSYTERELLKSKNPFAIAVLASKYLIKSKNNEAKRYSYKHKIIEIAIKQNLKYEQIVNLLRFIYLILVLPENLELKFESEFRVKIKHQKYKNMKFKPITTDMRVSNRMHVALYGETFDDRLKREKDKVEREKTKAEKEKTKAEKEKEEVVAKAKREKVEAIRKLLAETDLSDEKIADIFDVTNEFISKIREGSNIT